MLHDSFCGMYAGIWQLKQESRGCTPQTANSLQTSGPQRQHLRGPGLRLARRHRFILPLHQKVGYMSVTIT